MNRLLDVLQNSMRRGVELADVFPLGRLQGGAALKSVVLTWNPQKPTPGDAVRKHNSIAGSVFWQQSQVLLDDSLGRLVRVVRA